MSNRDLLDEQIAYYRARAPEYDEWFLRHGRYDQGEEHSQAWSTEVTQVEQALQDARPAGHILELACGTGLWTRHLVGPAQHVVAVDASPEVIALNRKRVKSPKVDYVQADLFDWDPGGATFDFIFFGFWLTHVPPDRFDWFWSRLRSVLEPGGRVFFVDNARDSSTHPVERVRGSTEDCAVERRLNDGRRFRLVKVFYEPAELEERLNQIGWRGNIQLSGSFFIYGNVAPG